MLRHHADADNAPSDALLNAAVTLAELGYRVFPCKPGLKVPATRHGCLDATYDIDQLTKWWTENPDCNIGLSTDGLIVVDVDSIDGNPNRWLSADQERKLLAAGPAVQRTPSNGRHFIFRAPAAADLRNSAGKIAPHIDTRANGGYIVVAPSRTDAGQYSWQHELNRPPEDLTLPPDDVLAALSVEREAASSGAPLPDDERAWTGAQIPNGSRNDALTRLAGAMRGKGMTAREIEAALLVVNQQRCRPPLAETEVEGIVNSICRYAPEKTGSKTETDPWLLPVDDDDPWPSPLGRQALVGPAGEFVRVVGPHTESDEAALLFHFLAYAAATFGRHRYFLVEGADHYPQLFLTFVGPSAKGRKGTALRNVERVFREIDRDFVDNNVVSGLSSGEGLIHHVRDPVQIDGELIDPGVTDKRLLVVEAEFANPLKQIRRETNILSAVLRDAWDTGRLRTLTKHSPTKATGAHVNVIAHTTREELRRLLTETEQANGFANRFLWPCTRRSRLLPDGGNLPLAALTPVLDATRKAADFSNCDGRMNRSAEAQALWHQSYPKLAADRDGLLGSVTNRAEAQVLRLSLLFALLECSAQIHVRHLLAALECWRYCEDSARYIFGNSLGDSTAEELQGLLKAAATGLSREQIRDAFQRHKKSSEIRRALGLLQRKGLSHHLIDHSTGGRPAEIWHNGPRASCALCAVSS